MLPQSLKVGSFGGKMAHPAQRCEPAAAQPAWRRSAYCRACGAPAAQALRHGGHSQTERCLGTGMPLYHWTDGRHGKLYSRSKHQCWCNATALDFHA